MKHYEIIEKNIASGDVETLREAIGNICYTSRDFSSGEFDELVAYVESKGIKLKDDSLTGKALISSQKNSFTDDDFSRAIFELKKNFCDERIEDVKTIGKTLYKSMEKTSRPVSSVATTDKQISGGSDPNFQSHQSRKRSKVPMGVLVAIAILVIALIVVLIMVFRK